MISTEKLLAIYKVVKVKRKVKYSPPRKDHNQHLYG